MKKALFVLLVLSFLAPVPSHAARAKNEMPMPRLLFPHDDVDLNGKTELEFSWGNETGGEFDRYDFAVYKGSVSYEPYRFIQKEIPKGTTSIRIPASEFEPGKVYSWSLRTNGRKRSMKSYSVFTVRPKS